MKKKPIITTIIVTDYECNGEAHAFALYIDSVAERLPEGFYLGVEVSPNYADATVSDLASLLWDAYCAEHSPEHTAADVIDHLTQIYAVVVSNGAHWASYAVRATSEDAATKIAEDAANDPKALAREARDAAEIGQEPAGPYRVVRVEERADYYAAPASACELIDAGGEG